MAYDGGGYAAAQPYGGRGAPRPPPGGEPYGQYAAPAQQQQQYDGYNDGYGYGDYGNGGYGKDYGQDYGDPYQNPDYGRGPPPQQNQQDYYGAHPAGRGAPRPMPRGGGPHPPPARDAMRPGRGGRPPPVGHPNSSNGRHQPPMNDEPLSPRHADYGGGYGRGDMDQQMADQMAGMDIHGQRQRAPPSSRSSAESQRSYGRPPMNGRGAPGAPPPRGQPQGYFDPRRGPPAQGPGPGGYAAGGYDDGYGRPGPQRPGHEFGAPARSMTMPNESAAGRDMMPPPQRTQTNPYEDPAGRGGVPPRSASAMGSRPAPQRTYPPDNQGYGYDNYAAGQDGGQGYGPQPPRASYDNGYGSYYDGGRPGAPPGDSPHRNGPSQSSMPDFDAIGPDGRNSFDQAMRPGMEYAQPGAHQTAKLNHAKSQPDLRQPQAAIFEMAGDVPSVPPVPQVNPALHGYGQGPSPVAHERMPPRGPSAPPGPTNVPTPTPMGPSGARPDMNRNPDSLPSHPTPVRAGLMANSVVNLNDKPPPVRNYGGVPQPTRTQSQPQLQPQQAPQVARAAPQKPPEPPVTSQELEQLRMVIKNNPNDQQSAIRLSKRLLEAADVLVLGIPDPRARAKARERYVLDAHKILKKLSSSQNIEAMFILADNLGRGVFGGDSDTKEAFTLYQSAAKLGHAAAAYRTAVCCEIGHEDGGGTRRDPLKAMQWYKRAASLGDPPAMYKVGMILLKGLLGQARNPREAIGWLKRAAERADAENPHALHEMGLLYESAQPNDVIIRDERYALSLFQQAAELGYKFSQFRLGSAYEYGSLGCPVDPRMSIMWYSQAAQRGEHQAELALSGWYLTGSEGVLKQSDQEAYLWARKAAVAGLAKAEYAMGYFTEVGIGAPSNLEDAKRWYWRAAAQDFPKARERLEDLKRGRNHPGGGARQRERISRSQQQEGDCTIM